MRRLLRASGTAFLLAAMAPVLAGAQSVTGTTAPTAQSSPPAPSVTPATTPAASGTTAQSPTVSGAQPGQVRSSGLAGGTPQPTGGSSATSGGTPSLPVPGSFRNIHLGMTLDQVKSALQKDPYFDYTGPPDVSMLANPDENLIETSGYSFISRAYFQFYQKKLYIMILMLNPREISYYTMYTTLRSKYGPSTSLSPGEVVWESPRVRLSLERPLSVKYIDRTVFNRLKAAGKMKQSERSISRNAFLNQF